MGGGRKGVNACAPRGEPPIYPPPPPSLSTSPHLPTHRPCSALPAPAPSPARTPSALGYGRLGTHRRERDSRSARRMDTRGERLRVRARVLAHFVQGHAAPLATECVPLGRVSRRRWGASSHIEQDPPRDPSGLARGWQVRLRGMSPRPDGFLRIIGRRASAPHLCVHPPSRPRVLDILRERYAALNHHRGATTFALCPSFACGGLGTHGYGTGTPPRCRRSPCTLAASSRRHPVSCAAIPAVLTLHDDAQSGRRDVRTRATFATPQIKGPRSVSVGPTPVHGRCMNTAVGRRGCRLHLDPASK